MLKKLLIITGLLSLTACSSNSSTSEYAPQQRDDVKLTQFIQDLRTNKPYNDEVVYSPATSKKLNSIYREWAGTRYRLGGTTKSGIDCSAFMQTTFIKTYGLALPRTTSEQQHVGKRINKSELKQGDLVFFRKNRHVGVYIGNGQFMHASSSQGVTISSLNESYWSRNYTQSRRVL
ncbi:NlpC/P60 family protein [Conservatibacter flavescens]|uniref:NlpC/P60 domain-containing protein n=1 Tax=Conservatibacter flavescens TaxID=28161 RepID=A0A2M8S569_9PAST|nr:NlpC/P60 family protein [Conservatibacter flavescens]PJG86277.1 hypothetical protein CVP05_00205 [Conservatibacter flavescens]